MIRLVLSMPGRVFRLSSEKYHQFSVVKRFKSNAQIMIWSSISGKGVGEIHFVDGHQNSESYVHMMKDVLLPQISEWFPYRVYRNRRGTNPNQNQFIYMQDHAPCHTAKKSMQFLEEKSIPVLAWPANSPDLNPIENVWTVLKKHVPEEFQKLKNASQKSRHVVKDIELLKLAISSVWHNNDSVKKTALSAIDSMPKRIIKVIEAKGAWTKY